MIERAQKVATAASLALTAAAVFAPSVISYSPSRPALFGADAVVTLVSVKPASGSEPMISTGSVVARAAPGTACRQTTATSSAVGKESGFVARAGLLLERLECLMNSPFRV